MQSHFDWDALRAFTAAADEGSLSGAARRLGMSQPTASRQLMALEADLGVRLFERTPRGLQLTETGLELLQHARGMNEAANRLALAAQGRSETLAGVVRITASEVVSAHVLPPVLVALRRQEPEIEIELVASDQTGNLLQREADIAIRMYRPTQADVMTKKLTELALGAFASRRYLARRGTPTEFAQLRDHDVVGFDRDDQIIVGFQSAGLKVDRHFFRFRCDNQLVAWRMVVQGMGIGFTQVGVGERERSVQRILPDMPLPKLPVWLTAHAELRTNRRIRRVYDFLAQALSQLA
jgi:DNA-binding transcriptional LysR family regulator